MINTKFIMSNGQELYPRYLEKEKRQELHDKYKDVRGFMWCGCKPNEKLYYRISDDLRIYPEHNNYRHSTYCCRYKSDDGNDVRQTAYIVKDEDGEVLAYTSFDPLNFTESEETVKEQDNEVPDDMDEQMEEVVVDKDEAESKTIGEVKEPKLTLEGLTRCINIDCFTEKILNGIKIPNKEVFAKYVYGRMKKVSLKRAKKSIGELTLEKDGVRFLYLPLTGIIRNNENGKSKCYIQTRAADGKVYNNFIYPKILDKAVNAFVKRYKKEPDADTYMAAFQYLKRTRTQVTYRVLGRVHLFQVSNNGLYCRSMTEMRTFDFLQCLAENDSGFRYYIPPEDENIGAIIEHQGKKKKKLIVFGGKRGERIVYDKTIYELQVVKSSTELTKEMLDCEQ